MPFDTDIVINLPIKIRRSQNIRTNTTKIHSNVHSKVYVLVVVVVVVAHPPNFSHPVSMRLWCCVNIVLR